MRFNPKYQVVRWVGGDSSGDEWSTDVTDGDHGERALLVRGVPMVGEEVLGRNCVHYRVCKHELHIAYEGVWAPLDFSDARNVGGCWPVEYFFSLPEPDDELVGSVETHLMSLGGNKRAAARMLIKLIREHDGKGT